MRKIVLMCVTLFVVLFYNFLEAKPITIGDFVQAIWLIGIYWLIEDYTKKG